MSRKPIEEDTSFMGRHKRFMIALPRKWNPQARLCAMALFCHAKDDGTGIYAGVTRLCEISGLSRSGLMRALKFLSDNQFLSSDGEHVHENGARTTLRRLNLREILNESEREKAGGAMDGTSPMHDDSWSHSCENHSPMHGTQTESINREITESPLPVVSEASCESDMDSIWSAYPSWRRGSRKPVEASLRSAIKRGAKVQDILDGIRRAVAFWPKTSKEPRSNFIPNLTTFLNQDRWTVTDEEHEANWSRKEAPRHQSAADLAEQNAIRMMQRMGMNR